VGGLRAEIRSASTTPMRPEVLSRISANRSIGRAKDEDAVLLIMGEGPATATAAEEK